jgi:bla regulator protein blaR1
MTRFHFRFVSCVVMVVTGLAWQVSRPTSVIAQAPAVERLPSFEVASIKQNTSTETRARMGAQPGGRVTVTNTPVRSLIATAFGMFSTEALIRARILGGPDWLDSERYDINAKANAEFQFAPDGPPKDMLLMMRSLLEERFRLKVHHETREVPSYELVVARADGKLGPEMHKSNVDCEAVFAARRAGAPPPPRGPIEPPPCALISGPARTIAGAASMQQLATNLTARVERVVVDKTGLIDRFDFMLTFTPDQRPLPTSPPGLPPIDPNGPGLFTALQEQLGLKLVPSRAPMDVLVIDTVEHPTPD